MIKLLICLFIVVSLKATVIDIWDKNFYEIYREDGKWCLAPDIDGFGVKLNQRLQKIVFNYAMESIVFRIIDTQKKDDIFRFKAISAYHNCNEIGVVQCFNEPTSDADINLNNFIIFEIKFLENNILSIKQNTIDSVRFYTDNPKRYKICKSQIEQIE